MKEQMTIAVLICYFGKLPWYFNYFIHSCKYNPSIDFIIITDDTDYARKLPGNVKLLYKSLQEINKLATKRLGLNINIKAAYKLCDFKPAYGLIL